MRRMEEKIEVLVETGLSRQEAMILLYLIKNKEAMSIDLEREFNLRQPEVSVAIKKLKNKGFINAEIIEKKGRRGRPPIKYTLATNVKDALIKTLEEKIKKFDSLSRKLQEVLP